MLIRFLRDFRSASTGEEFYAAGQTADLDRGAEVVAEGAAEAVPLVAREGQVAPKDSDLKAKPDESPPRSKARG